MNNIQHHSQRKWPARAGRRLVHGMARAARAVAAAVAECDRAQRHLAQLRLQPDRYALDGNAAPATYAEFLFRSPGAVWHEPSARERGSGVRR